MHWDGAEWSFVAVPHPGEQSAVGSISAPSSDDVWAVGDGTDSQGPDNTDPAFEHWDGNQWTLVPGQRTLEDQEILSGVGRGWA